VNIKEFREMYEIDRKAEGIRAIPKGVDPSRIKKHKYAAQPTVRVIDGRDVKFPSKKEALCYDKLALMEKAGVISNLVVTAAQSGKERTEYWFIREPIKLFYIPDFTYTEVETGKFIVADAKGFRTAEYKRKKRLMLEMYEIEITEF